MCFVSVFSVFCACFVCVVHIVYVSPIGTLAASMCFPRERHGIVAVQPV